MQPLLCKHFWREYAHFFDFVAAVVAHHPDRLIWFHFSRYHPDVSDNAAINVEDRIEHQRTQCFVLRFFRRRNPVHNRFQNFVDPDSHLRARFDRLLGWNRENFLQLTLHRRHIRVRQIDFVNNRHNRQALFMREMDVRHCLRLYSLRSIDNQERAFARGEAS